MKQIICFLLWLCPYIMLAQAGGTKAIHVGDIVPDIEFKLLLNKTGGLKLSDHKGKLVILDFWATWCGGCIQKFNILDSMQALHREKLSVILINSLSTKDSKKKLELFYENHVGFNGARLRLPIVYNDTMAVKLFPYDYLPHYAWINEEGVCIAITGPEEVTPENLIVAIKGKTVNFQINDNRRQFQKGQSLFIKNDIVNHQGILFQSTLSKHIPGYPTTSHKVRDDKELISRYTLTNESLLIIIKRAYETVVRDDRIVADQSLKARLFGQNASSSVPDSYCYELTTQPIEHSVLLDYMKQDIQRYFGIKAHFETNMIDCYELVIDSCKLENFKTKGAKASNHLYDNKNRFMQNRSLETLSRYLDDKLDKNVVLKTTVNYKIDLRLPDIPIDDVKALQKALQRYGIQLQSSKEKIEQFIITKS